MRFLRPFVALVVVFTAIAIDHHHDASACMCIRERIHMLTPNGQDDTPLNARVRFNVSLGWMEPGHRFLLRHHVTGIEVPTTTRGPLPNIGTEGIIELTPKALLDPSTRYEVALLKPNDHPSAIVFGTFKTTSANGAGASDKTPPNIGPLGKVTVGGIPRRGGGNAVVIISSCGGDTPHVTIDKVSSSDPGRPNAQLLYAVWLGDSSTSSLSAPSSTQGAPPAAAAAGIDTTKPPTGIFSSKEGKLTIGATDLCAMDFPFPSPKTTPFAWIGISAIDEAGNVSTPHRLKIDLRAP